MPIAHLSFEWGAPPVVLAGAAIVLALFAQAFIRLRRRRAERAPWTRPLLFGAGLALLVLPLVSPLDEAADEKLLSAHMLQHVLIGDAAVALLVVAVRGPLVFFLLPPALLRPLAGLGPLRAVLSVLVRPLFAIGLWAAVIYAWHIPAAYDYAAAHPLVHDLEHLTFVVAGTLVWIQLVDPARHGRLRRPERIFFALGMVALMQPLVDALLFSSNPAYPRYADQPDRLFGLSPLTDQRLAGVVMMTEQLLGLGICVAFLLRPYLRERRERLRGPALQHGSR
ncbi:MAG TPA: cytochrome c oxidase assembly protein [Gaiellaceae bacterium]